jgi:hypothetical protein
MLRRVGLVRIDVSEDICHPEKGGAKVLGNFGYYNSHAA